MSRRWQGCRWQRLLALALLLLAHSCTARPHEYRRFRQQQADDDMPASLPSSNGRRRLEATQLAADISAAAANTHDKRVMRKRAAGEKVRRCLPLSPPKPPQCAMQSFSLWHASTPRGTSKTASVLHNSVRQGKLCMHALQVVLAAEGEPAAKGDAAAPKKKKKKKKGKKMSKAEAIKAAHEAQAAAAAALDSGMTHEEAAAVADALLKVCPCCSKTHGCLRLCMTQSFSGAKSIRAGRDNEHHLLIAIGYT